MNKLKQYLKERLDNLHAEQVASLDENADDHDPEEEAYLHGRICELMDAIEKLEDLEAES